VQIKEIGDLEEELAGKEEVTPTKGITASR
jgi:hypothetical protein